MKLKFGGGSYSKKTHDVNIIIIILIPETHKDKA